MNSLLRRVGLLSVAFLVLVSGTAPLVVASQATSQDGAQLGSWALGLVAPDGSTFANSQHLLWQDAVNITAIVRLPFLNSTDNTVLAVLSIMLSDSSVLQISAGLFPGTNYWKAVGWYIRDITMNPQQYEWVLNSTEPLLIPGSSVLLSIFKLNSGWEYKLVDEATGRAVQGLYSSAAFLPPRSGDQELFALESYTSNSTVMVNLSNLTLVKAQVNGETLVGGTYYLTDWQPSRQPLFVVGGLPAPSGIGITALQNGTFVWRWSNTWQELNPFPPLAQAGIVIVVIVCSAVIAFYFAVVRRYEAKPAARTRAPASKYARGSVTEL
jgi:hypothetical protein